MYFLFSTLPFSPFVAGALKLLAHMIRNGENYEEKMNGDIGG